MNKSFLFLAFASTSLVAASASAQGNTTDTPVTTADNTPTNTTDTPALFSSSYTPEKDKAATEKPKETLRWAGSSYFQQIGVSPDVVAPGLVQTYAPVADTFAAFQPRFSLTKDWQLRARITASYEFTDNANSTTTASRTLVFGDLTPEIDYKGIPKFWGIRTIAALGTGVPTSAASQARTLYVSPFAKLIFDKSFEKIKGMAGGDLEFIVGAIYAHPLYASKTAQLDDTPQYSASCFGGGSDASCANQASGAANVENSLTATAIVTAKWGKFSATVLYYLFNQWTYQFQQEPGVEPEPNGNTNFRQSAYFNVGLDWDFNGWLTGEIGYQMYRTILTGESTIGNPFFDPYQDMRVYFGVNIALDSLYEAIQGKKEDEGILRTKNEQHEQQQQQHRPFTF